MSKKRRSPKEDQLPAPLSARSALPAGYDAFLKDLKERIRTAQIEAAIAVNRELILHYWQTGRDILARQQQHGWGAKVIDQLARDLHSAFPDVQGFSPRTPSMPCATSPSRSASPPTSPAWSNPCPPISRGASPLSPSWKPSCKPPPPLRRVRCERRKRSRLGPTQILKCQRQYIALR